MRIRLENISKGYDGNKVVKNVSIKVNDGEIMVLLGPSGCGKTTILRMIAGLIQNYSGKIYFDETDVTNLPPQKRNTAMVFQNYALFPHFNLEENIAFGLKVRNLSKSEISDKVAKIIKSVELEGLEKRKIQELSGGQKQRVALARALVITPDILLFDEPLSNLDEKLRITMRQSIKKLQREFGITTVYVTHDQEEAMSIADHIIVMNEGEIQQCATPNDIYRKPKNAFVAKFVGQANLFESSPIIDNGIPKLEILSKDILLNSNSMDNVVAMIRPEHLYFDESGIEGIVDFKEELGLITRYLIKIGNKTITLDKLNTKEHQLIDIGEKVKISYNENDVVLL